ncbi:putative C6 transcription factor [Podospora appendiculata]|uniref:C6 transcription factor n=1 Tax=Podospora appendiculata TaxID=314037 RepID=A0AAE1C9Q9_9PEZI|nr:putative C6 transcription factor [Podospora appendiculata]
MDETHVHVSEPGESSRTNHHKTRRPHLKSRYGCTKCKERRIKCDELTPRCSRCNKKNLVCQYPKRPASLLAAEDYHHNWVEPVDPQPVQPEFSRTESGISSPEGSGRSLDSSTRFGSPLSPRSGVAPYPPLPPLPKHTRLDSPLQSQVAQTLAPAEFELLKHFIEHTSKDTTIDEEEQYTLQVGIPNLACQSQLLMRSVLAIAAVCKCRDIIEQPSVSCQDREKVLELLALADRHHMKSLRETQAALPEAKQYDCVLANAAMMGMYGSGSHCVRIWLVKTAAMGDQPLSDIMPKNTQWISLFRAAHLAYLGILNKPITDDTTLTSPARSCSPVEYLPKSFNGSSSSSSGSQSTYEYKVSSRIDQPRVPPAHVLSPILAATVGSAMAKLRENARQMADIVLASSGGYGGEEPTVTILDIQACCAALDLLDSVVAETFPRADDSMSSQLNHSKQLPFKVNVDPVGGQLAKVSPWLRRYAASITSMIPSRLPRRVIMAFVHKVPVRYLNMIEHMLSLIQTVSSDSDMGSITPAPDLSLARQLALDIFAHWLVLVVLLDNVWWIGCVGAWELQRVVRFRQDARWSGVMWNRDEDWWPESMFEVSQQFEKHRTRS